jgi:glutamate/aspartate transport system permease protein
VGAFVSSFVTFTLFEAAYFAEIMRAGIQSVPRGPGGGSAGAASKVAQRDGRLVEMYLFAALVYFVISFAASLLVRGLQRRVAIIR